MKSIDELIAELCPNGVKTVKIKDAFLRLKGTPITANKMHEIQRPDGDILIFAGGKTVVRTNEADISEANIINVPAVLVQSRGIVDFIYCDTPFTFKNEMWAYTAADADSVRYLYYVFKQSVNYFRNASSGMGAFPQISLKVTEEYSIPLPPLAVQKEIVRILDGFTGLIDELEVELAARRKQYEQYRDRILDYGDSDSYCCLGEVVLSLNTGLNPRQFFKLNTNDATNYYVTIRELHDGKIVFSDKTDKINDTALSLCNNRSNLEVGDVLFSGTGTIGETAVIDEPPANWNIKEGVYAVKPDSSKVLSRYLHYVFMCSSVRKAYGARIFGGTVKSISMKDLLRIKIPIPPLAEQKRIVEILDKFDALCNDATAGLAAEIVARKKQYEYYRDKLLAFKKAS